MVMEQARSTAWSRRWFRPVRFHSIAVLSVLAVANVLLSRVNRRVGTAGR
jgi:hypothetical protein